MTYVAPTTHVAGETLPAADWNVVVNDVIALNSAAPSDIVTALPVSPIDGQIIYYNADATNGNVWQLRYRSAASGSYKWEFVGGSKLLSTADGGTTGTGASFADLASGTAPSISLPLTGDYHLTYGEGSITSPSGAREFRVAPTATGLTAGTAGTYTRLLSSASEAAGFHFEYRADAISGTLKLQFLSATYATVHSLLYLSAQPIRVG